MSLEKYKSADASVLVCFSHLRWNFVYQRPQHLLSRYQQRADVYFWEEPLFSDCASPSIQIELSREGVTVITPMLPARLTAQEAKDAQRNLLDQFLSERGLHNFVAWYYTPMALLFSDHLAPQAVVYDCMDELSAFDNAPPDLIEQERRLFERADVVFTGGASLFEAKRDRHRNVHQFSSSIDHAHFSAARHPAQDPHDAQIPHPRVGFFGVLDERLDRDLLAYLAHSNPDLHFVLIGPIAKIREEELPRAANLHYLGKREYAELPSYLAHWDVAILPFAQNASTHFISPTKTPEYLAAGKQVVSTPIRDVVRPYGEIGLVEIAETHVDFSNAIRKCLARSGEETQQAADKFLAQTSWDSTFEDIWKQIQLCLPMKLTSAINPASFPIIKTTYEKDGAYV